MVLSIAMYHNNSVKHQSFVYTQLNDQTVLFLTIRFIRRHLFAFSLNVKPFYCCILMCRCMRKYNNAMKTSEDTSLEKYTSRFIERVLCERELETEQNCNISTPTLMAITVFLSHSPGLLNRGPSLSGTWSLFQHLLSSQLIWGSELQLLNRGSWGAPLLGTGSLYSILSPTDSDFLCTELYYCFTPTQIFP